MTAITSPLAGLTSFTDMALTVSPYVPGCPSSVISSVVKRVVTDLCARAGVWREYGESLAVTTGDHEYTLATPSVYGEIIQIYSARITIDSKTTDMSYLELSDVQRLYPNWPVDTDGTPVLYTHAGVDTILLAPVPDADGTLVPYVGLQPTPAATVWPSSLYARHRRCVLHGTLHDLMMMPERPWTSDKTALYHGKQWTYLLNSARINADRGFNRSEVSVQMRPMA